MKLSDVEDYQHQRTLNNHTNSTLNLTENALGFIDDDDMEDVAAAACRGDERQLEELAHKYMMKSPATLAMRRKSNTVD